MKAIIHFRGRTMIGICAIAITLMSQVSFGQESRLSVEFRPGVNFATKDLADADLKTGVGLEGVFAYRLISHFGVYAGWGWNRFSSNESFAGPDVDFEETGYSYGLQFMHPIGKSPLSMVARAGVLSNHIEVEDSSGKIIGDSGHGFSEGIGWQVEARLCLPMGEKWCVMPSVRYRSLPREIKIGAAGTDVVLSYISAGLVVARTF